jgi:hypothetical protein
MLKLTFYVPIESKEVVKKALFAVGAGKIGNYDMCSFETLGYGQFRALIGANPTIGKVGEIEIVSEVRVEMVIDDHILLDAISALKAHHPYETPAFNVINCLEV